MSAPVFTDAELVDQEYAEATEAPAEPENDPEAPFGRRLDGTPKKAPGGRPAGKARRGSGPRFGTGGRRTSTGQGVKPPPKRPASKGRSSTSPDYRPGLRGWLHLFAAPMLAYKPLQMDAAALLVHGENVVEAVNETAKERPEVRALCEKAMKTGPWAALAQAGLGLGAQLAVNHGVIPLALGEKFGAVGPDVLAAHLGAMVAEQTGFHPGAVAPDVPVQGTPGE